MAGVQRSLFGQQGVRIGGINRKDGIWGADGAMKGMGEQGGWMVRPSIRFCVVGVGLCVLSWDGMGWDGVVLW